MTIYLLNSDARHIPLADRSVQCVVTSPPYWGLRDYGVAGQIGLEKTPQEYVASIVQVMREVWRVLRDDGVLWLNLGDSYAAIGKNRSESQATAKTGLMGGTSTQCQSLQQQSKIVGGLKPKDLAGIPWRVAFALQDDGWYLRSDIIWSKPNPMPESVTDRPTKAHEYIFLLAKSERYFYDSEAIKEPAKVWEGQAATFERTGPVSEHVLPGQSAAQHRPNRKQDALGKATYTGFNERYKASRNGKNAFRGQGAHRENETGKAHREGRDVTDTGNGPTRNRRSVWTVATRPYSGAHFATFPPELVEPMILAGSRPGDIVLDPFSGSGTVGRVSAEHGRRYVGLELNPAYIDLALERTSRVQTAFQFGSVQQSFAADAPRCESRA